MAFRVTGVTSKRFAPRTARRLSRADRRVQRTRGGAR